MIPLRILLIEDSELDAGLILRQLFEAGYQTISERVENADQLTEVLDKSWDVVIADFRLPDFNAIEALKIVQEAGIDTPFIIVSGAIGEETAVALMKSGARDYIMKDNLSRLAPVVERELIEAEIRLSQKKAHEALLESERNLKNSQRVAHVGHWIIDVRSGQESWSDEMYQILGLNPAKVKGSLTEARQSAVYSEDLDYYKAYSDINELQNLKDELEYRIIRPDGTVRYILEQIGEPFQDASGRDIQYSGVVHDITEQKLIELDLLQKMEESKSRARELETVALISSKIRQANTQNDLVVIILEELIKVLKADHATIAFFDEDYLCSEYAINNQQLEHVQKRDRVSKQFLSFVKAKKLGFFEKIHPMAFHELPPWLYGYTKQPYSMVAFPIKNETQIIGIIYLDFLAPMKFEKEHRNLVEAVADLAGSALKRMAVTAELKSMVKLRERELESIYEVTSSASVTLDINKALDQALGLTLAAVHTNGGAIFLLEEKGVQLNQIAVHVKHEILKEVFHEQVFKEHLNQVVQQGKSVVVPKKVSKFGSRGKAAKEIPWLFIGLPMRAQDRVVGVLAVIYEKEEQAILEEMTLLSFIADHLALVVENTRLYQKAEHTAVLEERSRLARELHDSVTQSLYSANLYSAGARRFFSQEKYSEVDSYLTEIGNLTQQALKDMRLLVYELRSPELRHDGLIGALQNRLDAVERRSNIEVEIEAKGIDNLPEDIEENLYWIAIESLNNALKHAQATKINLSLKKSKSEVVFLIQDNGVGFTVEKGISSGGFGLETMRERSERIGGKYKIISTEGNGTTIEVRFSTRHK